LRKAIFSWGCRTTPDASGEVPARPWKKRFYEKRLLHNVFIFS
jgi:hypothetical protein